MVYPTHTGIVLIFQIDLDTIDVSNLNRQFLFRKEHVKKSKAEVRHYHSVYVTVCRQFCVSSVFIQVYFINELINLLGSTGCFESLFQV